MDYSIVVIDVYLIQSTRSLVYNSSVETVFGLVLVL